MRHTAFGKWSPSICTEGGWVHYTEAGEGLQPSIAKHYLFPALQ